MAFAKLIPSAAAATGAVLLSLWLTGGRAKPVNPRLPGADAAPERVSGPGEGVPARPRGTLVRSDGAPADLPGAWPRFRGGGFDNISAENVPLARNWGPEGPPVLWSIDVGEGYAGAAVRAGRVYLLDYDREKQADALRCLSLADGREIWRYSYPVRVKRNHGMSRTVPAVTEKYVVALGPKCHVTCLDATTGEFRWAIDLVREYGTKVPLWYAGQCPLIDRGRAILGVGGKGALMMAVDCRSGDVVWKTPNPRGWQMTHSSVMPMEFEGKRMYVYCATVSSDEGGVVGVSADDGSILWQTGAWTIRIVVPSPVIVGDGRVFLSGGYNAGSMMLQLAWDSEEFAAEPLFRLEPTVFAAEQHTPILYKGHIYGVRQEDKQLVCLDLAGNVVWASGSTNTFGPRGLGPYLIADGLIFVMNDKGLLTLVEATPSRYKQLAQAKVLDGHESWGPMAIAGGRLILRDLTHMMCLDVGAKPGRKRP